MKNTKSAKQPTRKAKSDGKKILQWLEIILGIFALIAVIIFTGFQIVNFTSFDWSNIDTYTNSLEIILELAIGIEVARMLFSYNLNTLIELAVFIVIRKMLLIDEDFANLLLGVLALVLLFAARHFFINDDKICEHLEEQDS